MQQENSNKLGGRVRRDSSPHSKRSDKSMEIDERHVIKFFINDGMKSLDILIRFHKHYHPRVFCQSTPYFSVGEARRGRTYLSEITGPDRSADEGLETVITGRHEQDPHLSTRKLAQSLRISPTTACHYLSDILGLKYLRLRWVYTR
jgi:hypothetical protein